MVSRACALASTSGPRASRISRDQVPQALAHVLSLRRRASDLQQVLGRGNFRDASGARRSALHLARPFARDSHRRLPLGDRVRRLKIVGGGVVATGLTRRISSSCQLALGRPLCGARRMCVLCAAHLFVRAPHPGSFTHIGSLVLAVRSVARRLVLFRPRS